MAEGVALIRIDDEVDFRKRHGFKIDGKDGKDGKARSGSK
jgi:hypothetical protein